MRNHTITFYFTILLLASYTIFSQELPPINTFTTKDYNAENQNWDISQGNNKYIYVANNKGLLEYNGSSWKLYETPNETIMRSVQFYKDKIYTGFFMDFGFWENNKFGELIYTSIVAKEGIKMLEDEQIWSIIELDGWMLFKSLERIYLYNLEDKSIKIINANNKIQLLTKVDELIYFQEINKGLFKIENGVPTLVSNDPILKNNFLVNIFSNNGKLIFLTQKNGFYKLDNNNILKWKIQADKLLTNKTIYSGIQLKDGNIAIGTISDGFIKLDKFGNIIHQILQKNGLINNTVLSVFEDMNNNLWLGLDNGINSINSTSPFKIYSEKTDFLGTIYTSVVHNSNLYLGTNQGLFYRSSNSKENFKLINNTQGQVWNLKVIDNTLFCGHDSGVFIIKNSTATQIFSKQGTWDFIKLNNNTILQGCYNGLYILEKLNNKWQLKNKIEGFNNSSKHFVLKDNTIFVNHEYKGVFKIEVEKDFSKILNVEKDNSVEKGNHSSLIEFQNNILYTNRKGVFKYNFPKNQFVRDEVYSNLISSENYLSGKLIKTDNGKKLWAFSEDNIKNLVLGKLSNKPEIKTIPISKNMPRAASGYENILHLNDKNYLIGTSNGFIKLNLNDIKSERNHTIFINSISNFQLDKTPKKLDLSKNLKFNFKENNFIFSYNIPNYSKVLTTKYQYQLKGLNNSWSNFTDKNSVLFENIPFGEYTFKVRGKVGDKMSSNVANYTFIIHKPFYISNLAVIIYVIIILLVLYLFHLASKNYYKKQREALLEKTKKDAELKNLENSREIIKLNNEKLRNDIASKNKELATSTMNIIKKNEFLNTIKTELINGGENNIKQVVKIIDKNLNNTNDWKMFQEAFNNADKNFLKKIKNKHENLTPNDLRLCAYLRLNLSSKEIAPLLNISPRSVEVKRYRLRKKMNLSHDENLTNYILEI